MSDKTKMNKKPQVSVKISHKDYLFHYEDYDKLYTQILAGIPKKLKLPEKIEEGSSKQKFEAFFKQLKKKRSQVINDLINQFLDDKGIVVSKPSSKSEKLGLDDNDNDNTEFDLEEDQTDKLSDDSVPDYGTSVRRGFSQKSMNRAKLYMQKKKKELNLKDNDQVDDKEIKKIGKQIQKQAKRNERIYELNMNGSNSNNDYEFKYDHNLFDAALSKDSDDFMDVQSQPYFGLSFQNVINNHSSSSSFMNQYGDFNNLNKPPQQQKGVKIDLQYSNIDKLSRYYNRNHKDEKIFFTLFETQNKFTNMEEKIVSDSGCDKELLTCTLCIQFTLVPLKCQACKMPVCAKCAFEWIEKKDSCPIGCEGSWKLIKPSENELDKMLLQQYFYCEYKQFGCCSTNKIQDLVEHEQRCSYKAIPCKFCKALIIQNDMDNHMQNCEYRICHCKQCTFTYIAREKNTHNCIKTVLQHYQGLKQEFKQYQLDTEEKLDNFEKQLNDALEKNKTKQVKRYSSYSDQHYKKYYGNFSGASQSQNLLPLAPPSTFASPAVQPPPPLKNILHINKAQTIPLNPPISSGGSLIINSSNNNKTNNNSYYPNYSNNSMYPYGGSSSNNNSNSTSATTNNSSSNNAFSINNAANNDSHKQSANQKSSLFGQYPVQSVLIGAPSALPPPPHMIQPISMRNNFVSPFSTYSMYTRNNNQNNNLNQQDDNKPNKLPEDGPFIPDSLDNQFLFNEKDYFGSEYM